MKTLVQLSFILISIFMSCRTFSADMFIDATWSSRIIIEGDIVSGDYERFLDAVLRVGTRGSVFIATNGGDAVEAMKIGTLIRSLKFSVMTAVDMDGTGLLCPPLKAKKDCACNSSCLFVYIAGIERQGDAIGVHRIYLDYQKQRQLSLEDSREVSALLQNQTKAYLEEMSVPLSLIDKINQAVSDEIVMLGKQYVSENLTGYVKDYEEWLIAQCGSKESAWKLLETNNFSEDSASFTQLKKVSKCYDNFIQTDQFKTFYSDIGTAIKRANPEEIKKNTLVSRIASAGELELTDLIGKPKAEALTLLARFGFGLLQPEKFERGNIYTLSGRLQVTISASEELSKIRFNYYEKEEAGYFGHFHAGLSPQSPPGDFVGLFGAPIKDDCWESDVCFLLFETDKFSAQVVFEPDRVTPRALSLDKPGYWRKTAKD